MSDQDQYIEQRPSGGYVRLMRSEDTLELLREDPKAFLLLTLIALRARWREGFSTKGLSPGQAFLGDFRSTGMSEGEYRGAKERLESRYGLASFKGTNKGTIATIDAPWVYGVLEDDAERTKYEQATIRNQSRGEQDASKEKGKKGITLNEKFSLTEDQVSSINARCGKYADSVLQIISVRKEFSCLVNVAESVAQKIAIHQNNEAAQQNLEDFLLDMQADPHPPGKPASILRKLNNYLTQTRRNGHERCKSNNGKVSRTVDRVGRASGRGLPEL